MSVKSIVSSGARHARLIGCVRRSRTRRRRGPRVDGHPDGPRPCPGRSAVYARSADRVGPEAEGHAARLGHGPRRSSWSASADEGRRAAVVAQLEERYSATYDVVSAATATETADVLRAASRDGAAGGDPPRRRRRAPSRTAARSSRLAAELFPDVRRGLLVEWGAWGDRDTADLDPHAHGAGPDRLLRHPAVALARRVLPPHGHRVPRRVGPGHRAPAARGLGGRRPVDRALARGPRPAGPQRHPPRLPARATSPEARELLDRGRPRAGRRRPSSCCTTAGRSSTRRNAELAAPTGWRSTCPTTRCSTSSSWRRARPGSRRPCTRRRRGCGRSSSSGSRSAARPGRAR